MLANAGVSALRLIAISDTEWDNMGFVPRLWSTSQREIAHACGVSERAVRKWWKGEAKPDEPKQELLEKRFYIQRRWWAESAPETLGELLASAWLVGILKPDADDRAALERTYGIPASDWDRPAASA